MTGLRSRITSAARERFRQFGFAKTSMQEIAAACDMSAANLYRFYDGKLAIAAAVAAVEQVTLLQVCDAAVKAAGATATDQLIALFLANVDETRRRIKRTPLLSELGMTVARERKELRHQFLRALQSRIETILTDHPVVRGQNSAEIAQHSRLVLMASAAFALPWMMVNEPFGDPHPMIRPLITSLLARPGVSSTLRSESVRRTNAPSRKKIRPAARPKQS